MTPSNSSRAALQSRSVSSVKPPKRRLKSSSTIAEKAAKPVRKLALNPADSEDPILLKYLSEFCTQHHRFPIVKELTASVKRRVMLAGGISRALEQAIGNSPRLEILRAIDVLTPPGCDHASSKEIQQHLLLTKGVVISAVNIAAHVRELREIAAVTSTKSGQIPLFRLTPAGQSILNNAVANH